MVLQQMSGDDHISKASDACILCHLRGRNIEQDLNMLIVHIRQT
jgi:hypothetical protein